MITSYYGDISSELFREVKDFLRLPKIAIEQPRQKLPVGETYVSRLTLSEFKMNSKEIKKQFASKRHNYELIVVEPKSAGLASVAARDNRVDIVRINPKVGLSIFNTRYGHRLNENEKGIEIDLSFFFSKYMSRQMRPMMRILESFTQLDLPVLLTNTPNNPYHLRSYQGLQSLGRLLDLPNKQTNGRWVWRRIERNRKKQEGKIPFPGVEINGSED